MLVTGPESGQPCSHSRSPPCRGASGQHPVGRPPSGVTAVWPLAPRSTLLTSPPGDRPFLAATGSGVPCWVWEHCAGRSLTSGPCSWLEIRRQHGLDSALGVGTSFQMMCSPGRVTAGESCAERPPALVCFDSGLLQTEPEGRAKGSGGGAAHRPQVRLSPVSHAMASLGCVSVQLKGCTAPSEEFSES